MKKIIALLSALAPSVVFGSAYGDPSVPIRWDISNFDSYSKQKIYDYLLEDLPQGIEIYEEEEGVLDLYCVNCNIIEFDSLASGPKPDNEVF